MTSRSARMACLRASGAFARLRAPFTASTSVSTTSMANSPPSALSVEKVCRIGLMSARPLVSISDAVEMRNLAALAVGDQLAQRDLQVRAGVAADAAVAEQRDLVGARAQQRVVDADRAEFVDDQRGVCGPPACRGSGAPAWSCRRRGSRSRSSPARASRVRASAAGRTGPTARTERDCEPFRSWARRSSAPSRQRHERESAHRRRSRPGPGVAVTRTLSACEHGGARRPQKSISRK